MFSWVKELLVLSSAERLWSPHLQLEFVTEQYLIVVVCSMQYFNFLTNGAIVYVPHSNAYLQVMILFVCLQLVIIS